jgi:hypothetical protein
MNNLSAQYVSGQRFEPGTWWIQQRSVISLVTLAIYKCFHLQYKLHVRIYYYYYYTQNKVQSLYLQNKNDHTADVTRPNQQLLFLNCSLTTKQLFLSTEGSTNPNWFCNFLMVPENKVKIGTETCSCTTENQFSVWANERKNTYKMSLNIEHSFIHIFVSTCQDRWISEVKDKFKHFCCMEYLANSSVTQLYLTWMCLFYQRNDH